MRIALGVFALVALVSYASGMLHPLRADEVGAGDRALLGLASWTGVALVAADMLRWPESVERLLRRIVGLGAAISVVGILQFMVGINLVGAVKVPGLSINSLTGAIQDTGGPLRRVAGTALHPIEYGMVLALILPFALHFALREQRRPKLWWAMCILIGVALPMSLSRSALLGVAVEFVVLFWIWTPRQRLRALVIAPIFLGAIRVFIPGLLGTIFSLFSNVSNDPSLQGRADLRAVAGDLVHQAPWLGRGFGTWVPTAFREAGIVGVNHGAFDNQYIGTTVDTGYIGLAALVLLLIVSVGVARGIRCRAREQARRDLGQAYLAAFLAVAIGMATFDGLGFPTFMGLFLLLFGTAGAMWRITRDEQRGSVATMVPATVAPAGAP